MTINECATPASSDAGTVTVEHPTRMDDFERARELLAQAGIDPSVLASPSSDSPVPGSVHTVLVSEASINMFYGSDPGRVITISMVGPLMRYDAGKGLTESRQFVQTSTFGRLSESSIKVGMLEGDWLDRLALTIKVKAVK